MLSTIPYSFDVTSVDNEGLDPMDTLAELSDVII